MTQQKCEAIRPLISAALDGELDEDEFVQLSEHLVACVECRQVHRDYTQLRDGIRMSPPPLPPEQLTRLIRQETIEKPPPSPIVRFASRTGLKFGFSSAAAAVILVIVIAVFGFHGYDQRSVPAISTSSPAQNHVGTWPINQPVRIAFSKRMDQDSVIENLRIRPTSEHERLPISWDDNTLVIGASPERNVLLAPDTSYMIFIMPGARDIHGNPIGDFWTLSFRTGPPDLAIAPRQTDDISAATTDAGPDESEQDTQGQDQEQSGTGSNETSASESNGSGESAAQVAPSSNTDSGSTSQQNPAQSSGSGNTADPGEPEEIVTQPTATPEPTPDTTQSPAPTPTPLPSPTATPEPTATPAPTPTPRPDPTPEPTPPQSDPIPVKGAFGEVYWGNSEVAERLGAPIGPEYTVLASEQDFQRGLMFRRFDTSRRAIYVLLDDGTVAVIDDTWTTSDGDYGGPGPGDGLYIPTRQFGKVWTENPAIAERIGHALSATSRDNIESRIQDFNSGHLIYSRGMVYVIFSDQTWQLFPDTGNFQSNQAANDEPEDDEPVDDEPETNE